MSNSVASLSLSRTVFAGYAVLAVVTLSVLAWVMGSIGVGLGLPSSARPYALLGAFLALVGVQFALHVYWQQRKR